MWPGVPISLLVEAPSLVDVDGDSFSSVRAAPLVSLFASALLGSRLGSLLLLTLWFSCRFILFKPTSLESIRSTFQSRALSASSSFSYTFRHLCCLISRRTLHQMKAWIFSGNKSIKSNQESVVFERKNNADYFIFGILFYLLMSPRCSKYSSAL